MNLQQVKIFLPPDYMCFHRSSDKLKKKNETGRRHLSVNFKLYELKYFQK